MTNMMNDQSLVFENLKEVCKQWKITEFSLFGLSIMNRFTGQSDVDCCVEFSDEVDWDLFEIVELKRQLSQVFGREVDLVEKDSISNPFILKSIEENHQVLYSSHE